MTFHDIIILGSYGTMNVGDEAILTAMLKMMNLYFPENDITVIGPNPGRINLRHGVRALSSKRTKDLLPKIKLFRSSRVLILGGGGLLHDNRGDGWLKGMISCYASQALWAKLLGCRLALVGVSIGPLSSLSSRKLVSALCRACDMIITRDKESMNLALALGSNVATTYWVPDLTFCLDRVCDNGQPEATISPGSDSEDYCVLSLRPLYARANATQPFGMPMASINSLVRFLFWVVNTVGLKIYFLPFDAEHDTAVGKYFGQLLGNPRQFHLVTEHLSVNEIMELLALAKLTVGMRLHSLILSYVVGTPIVPIVYDTKVASFARQIGASAALTPVALETIEAESVQEIFWEALNSRESNKDRRERLESSRCDIHNAIKQLAQRLGVHGRAKN